MSIPFVVLDDPQYGEAVEVAPLIRRVIAKNPSKFTYHGTGTYIIGRGEVAVIDPGPVSDSHRNALIAALDGERVVAILITHCHSDHSPLAAWLREFTGAPTVAHGPHALYPDWVDDDSPEEPDEKTSDDDTKVEETLDFAFDPDVRVADGEIAASGDGWTIRGIHTPGHTSNHMCYWLEEQRALFTGDHLMGWSTTVIAPPDGNMRDYLTSLQRVKDLDPAVMWPTHGAPVTDGTTFIDEFVQHRLAREAGVLAAVRAGTTMIPDIVKQLYVGVDPKLHRAAGRSVLAHLIKLVEDGAVTFEGVQPGITTPYYPGETAAE